MILSAVEKFASSSTSCRQHATTKGTNVADIREMTLNEAEALLEYVSDVPEERWDAATACDPW